MAGTAISAGDFFVPPPGYSSTNVQSTGRMTVGASQTISLPVAGLFAMRLFDGVLGHRVSISISNVTLSGGNATLYDPYGHQVGSTGLTWPASLFIDAVAMSTGAYTLVVAASPSATGNATVTLNDIQDVTGTITPDGSAKSVTITVPGQNALLTLSTAATNRYSVVIGGNGLGGSVFIGDVRGQPLTWGSIGVFSNLIEPYTLPSGNYTVGVDFGGAATGTETINLYTVPDDVSGTITPGGASVTPDLSIPGRNARYTLTTPVNSRVSLLVSPGPVGTVAVQNGSTTVTSTSMTAVAQFVEPWAFATGQTIFVDPNGASSGSPTLTAYDVPPDTTGSIAIGGPAVPVTLLTPGQNGTLTFTPSTNQQVTVHVTGNSMGMVTVSLLDGAGQTLASNQSLFGNFDLSTVSVTAGTTYQIKVDPSGANTGTLNVTVSNP